MPIYPWSKNYYQRKILNIGSRLPDYNLDPPEDEPEYLEEADQIDDYTDIDVEITIGDLVCGSGKRKKMIR